MAALTQADLDTAAGAAQADWIAIVPDADFSAATFSISDLEGDLLATTVGPAISVDATAAGWGWGPGGMDLGTVLRHELGHVLGYDHGDESSLMGERLAAGETHTVPTSAPAGATPWVVALAREADHELVLSGTEDQLSVRIDGIGAEASPRPGSAPRQSSIGTTRTATTGTAATRRHGRISRASRLGLELRIAESGDLGAARDVLGVGGDVGGPARYPARFVVALIVVIGG